MQKQLLNTVTPNAVALIHLDIINNLDNVISDTSEMLLIFEDPIAGIRGTQNYLEDATDLIEKAIEIAIYFEENKIEFEF